jgi:hypothetical protein
LNHLPDKASNAKARKRNANRRGYFFEGVRNFGRILLRRPVYSSNCRFACSAPALRPAVSSDIVNLCCPPVFSIYPRNIRLTFSLFAGSSALITSSFLPLLPSLSKS